MDLKIFIDTPPWEWPEGAGKTFLGILRDKQADDSERLLAAEPAGDGPVINDELVDALLSIVHSGEETENLRAKAAIDLGPVVEEAFIDGFKGDFVPISEKTFRGIQESLHKLYIVSALNAQARKHRHKVTTRMS
jgi:hypothetical protein